MDEAVGERKVPGYDDRFPVCIKTISDGMYGVDYLDRANVDTIENQTFSTFQFSDVRSRFFLPTLIP